MLMFSSSVVALIEDELQKKYIVIYTTYAAVCWHVELRRELELERHHRTNELLTACVKSFSLQYWRRAQLGMREANRVDEMMKTISSS